MKQIIYFLIVGMIFGATFCIPAPQNHNIEIIILAIRAIFLCVAMVIVNKNFNFTRH